MESRKNKYKDETINKRSSKAMGVAEIDLGDNTYTITRTLDRKQGPTLVIKRDGELLFKDSVYQSRQRELEKLITGMNFTAFQCCVMYGRDFMNFPDLKPYERAKTLTDIRGLEKYVSASKNAADIAKSIGANVTSSQELYKEKEGELKGLRTINYEYDIKAFEDNKREEMEGIKLDIGAYKSSLDKIVKEESEKIKQLKADLALKNKSLAILNKFLEDNPRSLVEKEMETNRKNFYQLDADKKFRQDKISHLENEKGELTKHGEGPCPFCTQIISGALLRSRVDQISLDIMGLKDDISGIVEDLSKLTEEHNALSRKLDEIDKYDRDSRNTEKKIPELEASIQKILSAPEKERLDTTIKNLEKDLKEKEQEANPYLEKENQRKEAIKAVGVQLRSIKKEMDTLQQEKSLYEKLAEAFKRMRLSLFETMIEQLEDLIQQYLSNYSSELNVKLATERETKSGTLKEEFHIAIIDSNGQEMSYEMYSGGEKQKLRLSIARALAQFIEEDCGRGFNIIAFDEPNDALDDIGKETNFNLFQDLANKEGKVVLVTDHDANFKDRFSKSIVVTKNNGESEVSHE